MRKRPAVLNLRIKSEITSAGQQQQFAGGRSRPGEAAGRAEGAGENAVSAPQEQQQGREARRLLEQPG